ncbi:hypothetical protein CFC21_085585 [Triticum aestivum]|uniref:F-box domain-containing protein n=2 Tax=Triticum aestivum TaxID=4565 RepID=A0A3B6NYC6_WHEAT|nr:putative F-box/kelch-repeat protein At3g17540 [Triticum aestivum]XP_044405317.1 putative F-box/kelch-repeat protein At3g17540 [Triticum aestivum]KAF7081666.1 hypothetical protein CFC21_085585 [Triticum aestivum]
MARRSSRTTKLQTVLTDLPDALIVEILSRLPLKSLCCCKCVDTHWYCLISHPEHLKKLPQTLSGFFFDTEDIGRCPKVARHFANIGEPPQIDPSFPFLPPEFELVRLEDCCDGLLLCCSSQHPFRRLVCNPATERWVVLPALPANSSCVAQEDTFHLVFDRDVSSHFHVFQIVLKDWRRVAGINIYSSGTGSWNFMESGWDSDSTICGRCVFHRGMLHFVSAQSTVVSVDVEGKKWRAISVPEGVERSELGFLARSQGHLHYMVHTGIRQEVSIWCLEKYDSDEWTLKHRVSNNKLLNARGKVYYYEYYIISCHPDRSLICYANHRDKTLMAYDTDREEARVLCTFGRGDLISCFPYVPLFSDSSVPLSS